MDQRKDGFPTDLFSLAETSYEIRAFQASGMNLRLGRWKEVGVLASQYSNLCQSKFEVKVTHISGSM